MVRESRNLDSEGQYAVFENLEDGERMSGSIPGAPVTDASDPVTIVERFRLCNLAGLLDRDGFRRVVFCDIYGAAIGEMKRTQGFGSTRAIRRWCSVDRTRHGFDVRLTDQLAGGRLRFLGLGDFELIQFVGVAAVGRGRRGAGCTSWRIGRENLECQTACLAERDDWSVRPIGKGHIEQSLFVPIDHQRQLPVRIVVRKDTPVGYLS